MCLGGILMWRSGALENWRATCFCTLDRLPFQIGAFDIASAAGVFHHIQTAEHITLLREIRRGLSSNLAGYSYINIIR